MIPGLTELLEQIRSQAQQLAAVQVRLEQVSEKLRSNGHHNPSEDGTVESLAQSLQSGLQESLGTLTELGIELKDIEQGLVDFPALREDREVYLCWQLGEEEVAFWHEITSGFAGRQPLDDKFA